MSTGLFVRAVISREGRAWCFLLYVVCGVVVQVGYLSGLSW